MQSFRKGESLMFHYTITIQRIATKYLLALILLPNISNAEEPSVVKDVYATDDQFFTWTYKETPMGFYLPAKTDKPTPVLMFLHACHNESVSQHLWLIPALNAIEPCAVFIPTAPETQNTQYPCADWGGTYDSNLRPQMINALHELDSLIKTHDLDKRRQYLYGESMGGEGVYRLLMDLPTKFAGAVDAAGYTINKGAAQMAKTPLWILIGSDDEMSPIDSSRAIYNSILNAGGTMIKYTEYQGLLHVAGINKAREEPGLLEWLFAQNRSTGVIKKSEIRNVTGNVTPYLSYVKGKLIFSSQLPDRSTVTLFDLNGKSIFKTITYQKTIRLPAEINRRIGLWHLTNSQFTISGKIPLYQQ